MRLLEIGTEEVGLDSRYDDEVVITTAQTTMRTGRRRRRRPIHARRRGRIRAAVPLFITLLFLELYAIEVRGFAINAKDYGNMQQQSHTSDTDICDGDKGTCPAKTASPDDKQSISTKKRGATPIFLQNISTEELNVQATNYILSLLEHHIPTAAASIDNHLDELPLAVTLAIIVFIIVARISLVGILLGLIVGFICSGPIVLVARCCYRSDEVVSEENNVSEAIGEDDTDVKDKNNEDKIDECVPGVTGEKILRFAPGTKRSDGASKGNSNMRRRARRKKETTNASSSYVANNSNSITGADPEKDKRKQKSKENKKIKNR